MAETMKASIRVSLRTLHEILLDLANNTVTEVEDVTVTIEGCALQIVDADAEGDYCAQTVGIREDNATH